MSFREIRERIADLLSFVGQIGTVLLFAILALFAITAISLDWAIPGIRDANPIWAGVLVLIFGAGGLFLYREILRSRKQLGELTVTLSTERERLAKLQSKASVHSPVETTATQGKVPEVPLGLIDAAVAGDVVLVMGAGCSAQASLPTHVPLWLGILDDVSDGLDPQTLEIVSEGIAVGDNAAIESLVAAVGRDRVIAATRRALGVPDSARLPEFHRLLSEGSWTAVVGLTWDELDLATFSSRGFAVVRAEDGARLPELLRNSRPVLIKPIGDLERPETIALTWQDYRQVLERWPDLVRGLATLFTTRTLLFLGTSLQSIEQFVNGLPPRIVPQRAHYALVPRDRSNMVWQQGIGRRFNIQLVEMIPSAGYPELPAFVRQIVRKAPVRRRGTFALASARAPDLRNLRLKNIGLFESLDLPLPSAWSVLLGINGSGKSTILRAIGLALCGDESRVDFAAQRLLRSGTSHGSIELELGTERVIVELTRERERVRVSAPPITPVQAGTVLALGFPALRGVASHQPVTPHCRNRIRRQRTCCRLSGTNTINVSIASCSGLSTPSWLPSGIRTVRKARWSAR